jgi:hypothetical protein
MLESCPSSSGGGQSVQVVVRIRPTSCPPSQLAVAPVSPTEMSYFEGKRRFTFDGVLDLSASQLDVFEKVGAPCVASALKGFNGCILAYGQSHSGKTHTMLGPNGGSPAGIVSCGASNDASTSGDDRKSLGQPSSAAQQVGIIPRTFQRLFWELAQRPSCEVESTVDVSVVELYNEVLYDLLPLSGVADDPPMVLSPVAAASPPSAQSQVASSPLTGPAELLRIREDRTPNGRGIFVDGLSSHRVGSEEQALQCLRRAAERKHMGGTRLNETSSRSHTIVIVSVTQVDQVQQGTVTAAQLFLVDLAGSERLEKTGAVGERLKEAQNINLSLTLLGNVINKLTEPGSLHIPYRDSKLTRLLQDALGGNAITTLICTVSPEAAQASETLSTLLFAQRAKRITNRPTANKVLSTDEVRRELAAALREVEILREQVRGLSGIASPPTPQIKDPLCSAKNSASLGPASSSSELDDLKATVRSLLNELEQERSDGVEKDRANQLLRDRVRFHESRELSLTQSCSEWERLYNAEKLRAEAAMQKLLSVGLPSSGPTPSTLKDVPSVNRSDSAKGGGVASSQPSSKVLQRGGSVVMSKVPIAKAGTGAVLCPAPAPPSAFATGPLVPSETAPTPQPTLQSLEAKQLAEDANGLVRERMLLRQVDALREELAGARKFSVMCDKLIRDLDFTKAEAARTVDELTKSHRRAIEEVEAALEAKDEALTSLQGTLQTVTQEKALAEAKVTEVTRMLAAAHCAKPAGPPSGDLQHLELENRELHAENRANAMRLLDFTRRIDALSKEVNELKAAREKLGKELEEANVDKSTKERLLLLLGGTSGKDKSYFRRKLLECFATE